MKLDDVLKSPILSFNSYFLKYIKDYKFTLNEFLLLIYFLNYDNTSLNLDDICSKLNLDKKEVLDSYSFLIEKKVIEINTVKNGNYLEEIVSLKPFFRSVFANNTMNVEESINSIKNAFEESLNVKCTEEDIVIIDAWMKSGVTFDQIMSAIADAKYNGVCNIRYVDKLLFEKKSINKKNDDGIFEYNWLDE